MLKTSWWIVDLSEYPAHDIRGGKYQNKKDAEEIKSKMDDGQNMLVVVEAPNLFTALEKAPNASRLSSSWFMDRISSFSDLSELEKAVC